MTTSQKAALSLLISVVLFGAFTALSFTGLFDLIEARFFNPSVTSSITRSVSNNAEAIDGYLSELQASFLATLREPAIRRSFLPNQSAEDIFERSRIYELLVYSVSGLQWVRFIDSGGSRLHFSTYNPDILYQDRLSVSYRNYSESGLPYETIASVDGGIPKYIFDDSSDRILFSLPFYDSFEVFRGTALFSLSVRAVSDMLISEGRIKAGQDISVVSNPPGLISGMQTSTEKSLAPRIAEIWKEGGARLTRLESPDTGITLALFSVKTSQFFVGRLVTEQVFAFPQSMKVILLVSFFLTIYLTIFLIFNFRQDSVTVVQNRLKQLQISLIEQYYDRKGDVDWNRWSRELEHRRDEIRVQLKKGLKDASGSGKADIDILIDKSWDELLSVIGGRRESGIDEEKLQTILNRILTALPGTALSGAAAHIPASEPALEQAAAEAEEAEEIEEIEAVEEIEEAEEVEEIEAVGEIEEIEAAGKIAEARVVQDTDVIEDVEILTDADEAPPEGGDIEDAEVVEELEELEELEEIEEPGIAGTAAAQAPAAEADVPVIDMADMNLSAGMVDDALQAMVPEEQVEELEALEELEEVEELEEEGEAAPSQPAGAPEMPDNYLANLASQIEFSPDISPESPADETFHDDLEIVSPFSTIFMDFPEGDDNNDDILLDREGHGPADKHEEASDSQGLESLPTAEDEDEKKNSSLNESAIAPVDENLLLQLPIVYKPFLGPSGETKIETLEALPSADDETGFNTLDYENQEDSGIINEREGVHYINGDAMKQAPETDVNINQDFKDLVDSVIK